MNRVEEIEDAIDRLKPAEYRRLREWFHERDQQEWDDQLDRDSASGRLDALFAEADDESEQGLLRDWPPPK